MPSHLDDRGAYHPTPEEIQAEADAIFQATAEAMQQGKSNPEARSLVGKMGKEKDGE